MKNYLILVIFFLGLSCSSSALASQNIFYVLRYHASDRLSTPSDSFKSLSKNYKKIDILIPQAFVINEEGELSKEVEPEILDFAEKHALKIMPLVTNTQFSSTVAHQFLLNEAAQNKAIDALVKICQEKHFYGVQLDFEMVRSSDRDLLTHFYNLAAEKMHQHGFKISYAIAPIVTENPDTLFLKKIYENWEGAYDLKALGKTADFVTIMAYNQHGGPTTPGPTASLPWVRQTLTLVLKDIPPSKVSLGLADYSMHWYTGPERLSSTEHLGVRARALSYEKANQLVHDNKLKLSWDSEAAVDYVIYLHQWLNEYLFLEDAKSFAARERLVKKYKLHGVSVFDLGTEDPGIWRVLRGH